MAPFPPQAFSLSLPSGVAPKFDPTNYFLNGMTAAEGALAVPVGSTYVDLLSGAVFTATTAAFARRSIATFGPAGVYTSGTATASSLAGHWSTVSNLVTFATFIYFAGGASTSNLLQVANPQLLVTSAGALGWYTGATTRTSTVILTVNTPYFVAASGNNGNALNFVAVNLRTGVMSTSALALTSGQSGAGANLVVSSATAGSSWRGSIGPVLFLKAFFPMVQLRWMAANPFSLWYPSTIIPSAQNLLVGVQAAPAVAPFIPLDQSSDFLRSSIGPIKVVSYH